LDNKEKLTKREPLPPLETLFERHKGFYIRICQAYADAAAVCFSRHHVAPVDLRIVNRKEMNSREIGWEKPDEQTLLSWANTDDATRDAAYSVSLSVIEAEFGLLALSRADTKTGADYYVGYAGDTDLEDAFRLEVSGTDKGDLSKIRSRLREKVGQLRKGNSSKPGIAVVIGFQEKCANIEKVFDS
jgi:hypothetical protein